MNAGNAHSRTPIHLWIIGVLALLWNSMGAFDYLATQLELEFYMKRFTEEQLAYFYGFPKWVVACWAFAVWGAFVGSIALLMRRKWAVWAFAVALSGLCLTTIYNFGMTNAAEVMSSGDMVFTAIIWVISIFLLFYSWMQARRGVLG